MRSFIRKNTTTYQVYTEPQESEHDFFIIGHTSTSVSLASGLAKGRDLTGGNENIIAVIGDGSLSGGEAFEGLDYVAELGTNMIIIVNDNQMSIAENHGGLYKNLKELRDSNGQCECNFFKAMGLDYIYVNDGNDVQALIEAFSKVERYSASDSSTHQHFRKVKVMNVPNRIKRLITGALHSIRKPEKQKSVMRKKITAK